MPRVKKIKDEARTNTKSTLSDPALTRIANLLALILTKGESEVDKVRTLASAGFQSMEIAELLGKQPNNVRVVLCQVRKGNQKGKRTGQRKKT